MKHPKTQDECMAILDTRLLCAQALVEKLQDKNYHYNGTESMRQDSIKNALSEIDFLEAALRILGDDRPFNILRQTNYCRYL